MKPSESFGRDFGELVKARRRAQGLTRQALAALALGSPGASRRVAEIEDGQVASPALRVMEALAHALSIDLSALPGRDAAGQGAEPPPPALVNHALRLLGPAEHGAREAAVRLITAEWRASRIRLAGVARERAPLRPMIVAAQVDSDRAAFAEAEALLAEAEAQAGRGPARIELRRERGEIALLAGEPARAGRLIESAAAFLDPFSPDGAADLRHAAAAALHRHGRIFGPEGVAAAIPLLRRNLDYWRKDRHAAKWATTRNNLANALHDLALARTGAEAAALLEQAVESYRAALKGFTKEANPSGWSATQGNLATALANLARRRRGPAAAKLHVESAEAYRAALSVRSRGAKPADWAAAQAQLGLALGAAAMASPGPARARMLKEAAAAEEAALGVYSREATPDHWAAARNNLGNTLRAQARAGGGAEALVRAVAAYRDALSALGGEGAAEDQRRAAIRNNLALALTELAERAPRDAAAPLAAEAAASARAALAARRREAAPEVWRASLLTLIGALTAEARFSAGPAASRAASEAAGLCRQGLSHEAANSPRWAELTLALARALEAEAGAGGDPATVRRRKAEARTAYAAALSRLERTSPHAEAARAARRRLAA